MNHHVAQPPVPATPRLVWALGYLTLASLSAQTPPAEWTEASTGRHVVRLSDEPGTGSLYFHQNAFTEKGDKLVYTGRRGLYVVDLKSRKSRLLVDHAVSKVVVGKKGRQVYYADGGIVSATHLDTGETRQIGKLPREYSYGSGFTVNANETLLAGTNTEGGSKFTQSMPRSQWFNAIFEAHLPTQVYTIDIKSGELKVVHRGQDWFNHIQFSPTDPGLIMYCHEGPWHKLDRIWTIRTDGAGLRKIHERTMDMEIAGHEFWSPDGKTIWYDLQTPKGKEFWLAGAPISGGDKIRYKVARAQWSVHFNISWDAKLFAGDGGGPRSVAAPGNGQWIYLFTPKAGALEAQKLVDLAKHDYALEPNVMFTPDGAWIVFRSNMHGASYVYAVEARK